LLYPNTDQQDWLKESNFIISNINNKIMSCCGSNTLCTDGPSEFKMRCSNPCDNITPDFSNPEVNYLDILYDTTVGIGIVDGTASYIPYGTLTRVKFNTLVSLFGGAITPNTSTGLVTINETGLYKVSYSLAWNSIEWDQQVTVINNANGYRNGAIVINNPITSINQVYANSGDTATNVANETNKTALLQNGSATILINAGETISIMVSQFGLDDNDFPGFTSLFSSSSADITAGAAMSTRLEIVKLR
jgi:hypothetical protein